MHGFLCSYGGWQKKMNSGGLECSGSRRSYRNIVLKQLRLLNRFSSLNKDGFITPLKPSIKVAVSSLGVLWLQLRGKDERSFVKDCNLRIGEEEKDKKKEGEGQWCQFAASGDVLGD
ncbi:hypothetical protein Nepgr_016676 [Nepenthes gracilis]|uniref:Uncharacterized protein n=1 Tax=Nepenthes gracilis TaxID=150966 RepID=A0AAD3XSQ0_NEPGR|nr:hypothetical protein Nepgr_016676 [Nepenthes gracilis]